MLVYTFVGSCLATKIFIGILLATGGGWVIIGLADDERGSITMHLMHPNYYQITVKFECVCVRWVCVWVAMSVYKCVCTCVCVCVCVCVHVCI